MGGIQGFLNLYTIHGIKNGTQSRIGKGKHEDMQKKLQNINNFMLLGDSST